MSLPLISIAIPAYNHQFLETTLRSALGQSYPNIEIIISDQCPTNDIEAIAKKYPSVRYHRFGPVPKESNPALHNFAKALSLCNGEFVNLLCDDDVLHPFFAEQLIEPLKTNPNVMMSFSIRQSINSKNQLGPEIRLLQGKKHMIFRGNLLFQRLAKQSFNFIGETSTVLFRKSAIEFRNATTIDFFGKDLNIHPDLGLWMLCAAKGSLSYTPTVLQYRRHHENQDSKTTKGCPQRNWRYIIETMGTNNLITPTEYYFGVSRLIPQFQKVLKDNILIKEHLEWCIEEKKRLNTLGLS